MFLFQVVQIGRAHVGERVFFSMYWISYTNKIDWHDITEILLKVELNTLTLTL
jgi:hypothetical protein